MSLTEDIGFDPSTRTLCPDGTCTGILDSGGWCTECRRTWPVTANAAATSSSVEPADDFDDSDDENVTAAGDPTGDGFDPSRRLCADGACTGVVGADQRCSVCGQPATLGDA